MVLLKDTIALLLGTGGGLFGGLRINKKPEKIF